MNCLYLVPHLEKREPAKSIHFANIRILSQEALLYLNSENCLYLVSQRFGKIWIINGSFVFVSKSTHNFWSSPTKRKDVLTNVPENKRSFFSVLKSFHPLPSSWTLRLEHYGAWDHIMVCGTHRINFDNLSLFYPMKTVLIKITDDS